MLAPALTALAGMAYIAFGGLLVAAQDSLIFPLSTDMRGDPKTLRGWEFQETRLDVGDHQILLWHIPLENARGHLLYAHGSAGNISTRLNTAALFRELGLSVTLYDYAGYGESTGRPSERRFYQDADAAWQWLTQDQGVPPKHIVLFGRSLGGGATCHLGAKTTPAAIILESTFTALPDAAQALLPNWPMHAIVRQRFPNAQRVPKFTSPILIIHSPGDELVPFAHGRTLYERAPEPKHFLEIHGTHVPGFEESRAIYMPGLDAFLNNVLGPYAP